MEFCEIKGFGPKRIDYLKKSGIETVSDLLMVFPYAYADLKNTFRPSAAIGNGKITIFATVKQVPAIKYLRKGLFLITVLMVDANGEEFECGWFNQKYIKKALTIGRKFYLYGSVECFGKKLSMNNPILIPETDNMPFIYPLYRPIKGVPSSVLLSAMDLILKNVHIESFIDSETSVAYELYELNSAIEKIHKPVDFTELEKAKQSLIVENLSCNIALYNILKQSGCKNRKYINNIELLKDFISKLPYKITNDQRKAIEEIIRDLDSEKKMNRLLQGDVGCGKTIVALSAMFYAAQSGYQSVLMSPTELLAQQHYETAVNLFRQYNLNVVLISSALNIKQRQSVLYSIKSGEADIIIGTHALIQNNVEFNNLALIITDEQQRFGVKQRGMLENKAVDADCLVMTATPIPRTIALTVYGDLEQSIINSIPEKKASTETRFVPHYKISDMLHYICSKAEQGEATYIVCPRIDDDADLVSVNQMYSSLSATPLKKYLGVLHGRQSDDEKKNIMSDFSSGKIRVLITTSIIEVGIDVPTATTIIIFNAERYGLSQLHQLRGRVGRGKTNSFCFILSDLIKSEKVKERLDYFVSCRNGFELAEYDYSARSAGDFLGTRQHGNSLFSTLDKSIIDKAKMLSKTLLHNNVFKSKIFDNGNSEKILFVKNLTLN